MIPAISFAASECKTTTTEEVQDKLDIDTKVPKDLEGAEITVKTKDGKVSKMKTSDFKVVPRKQQYIVKKVKETERIDCTKKVKVVRLQRKNRISLMVGQGPKTGLDLNSSSDKVDASSRVGMIGGVQYQRLLTERVSLGGIAQSNKSLLIELGYDF